MNLIIVCFEMKVCMYNHVSICVRPLNCDDSW